MNDIVMVEEAAAFLHKHPGTIRRWIEGGKLKARPIGRRAWDLCDPPE